MERQPTIERLKVAAYRVPTDLPESDGTLSWDSTGMVVVELEAAGKKGLGYTYAHSCTAELIRDKFETRVIGSDAFDIASTYWSLIESIRNIGRPGIGMMAVSTVDIALWDLKAKLLDLPLAKLIGMVRPEIPAYASGGFTSYSLEQFCDQLGGWSEQGFVSVKIKVAREPTEDAERLPAARESLGPYVDLMVDANGGYSRKQAAFWAEQLRHYQVSWLEEPVSSDDLEGLRLLRDSGPGGLEIAAGEYGYDLPYFQRMLGAGAVDVLQADATRCGGITGFLAVGALCEAHQIPLSSHTAPAAHLHAACGLRSLRHMEWFHDHVRIENELFDGAMQAQKGMLTPDLSRPGHGLAFKHRDAERYAV